MKLRTVLLLIFCLVPPSNRVNAQELTFLTHELKPFTWVDQEDLALKGFIFDLCKETMMVMGYGPAGIKNYPFCRVLEAVQQNPNTVAFHLARTSERESTMKWVGPLLSNRVFFFVRKGAALPGNLIEDFKKMKSIGVGRGNASHVELVRLGFTNLTPVTNEMQAVLMLALGRVDAVPVSELVIQELSRQAEVTPGLIVNSQIKLFDSTLYMGFSKNIPDQTVAQWQSALDQVKSIYYERLYTQYISSDPLSLNTLGSE